MAKPQSWKMSKTMISEMPWTPTGPVRQVNVLDLPGVGSREDGYRTAPAKLKHSMDRSPDDVLGGGAKRKIRNLVKDFFGKLIISPSFLLSSLLVFLFVPDSVLKGTYSIDLRGRAHEVLKRLLDILSASIALAILSPLFVIIPILIKIDSSGSIFYRQVRVGQNRRRNDRRNHSYRLKGDRRNGDRRKENAHGRLFVVYKFRSMRQDAEKKSGPVWAQKGDPRITKVGRLLRATRADELPQFINILKGDMSLVGPRPERPFFVNRFVNSISQYHERLNVKPGLTGLAQVMGGYDTCIEDVYHKLNYDLSYVSTRSLVRDLRILLKTLAVVVCGKGVY